MRVVGPFVRGALSTLAVLAGGFLVVVGVAFMAGGSDAFLGDSLVGFGFFCVLLGLPLLAVGVVGWRRLWRLRDLPPENPLEG